MKAILLLLMFLPACMAEETTLNISNLSLDHQILFIDAMTYWRIFSVDDDSDNKAVYADLPGNKIALFREIDQVWGVNIPQLKHFRIVFDEDVSFRISSNTFCGKAKHELGHHPYLHGDWHSQETKHIMYHIAPPCEDKEISWEKLESY